MRKRALSQHVALVSVKRDRAKEGLRINEGLGAVSSLLRAEMFERQICQDGCGVSASQDQAFSSFQRQVKMSRRGAAGARHKMSSLLRAEMFERQIGQDGCGVSASQDQAFSIFQRSAHIAGV